MANFRLKLLVYSEEVKVFYKIFKAVISPLQVIDPRHFTLKILFQVIFHIIRDEIFKILY